MAKEVYRAARTEPVPMDKMVQEFIKQLKLASGINTQRIFAAWDTVSGASQYTLSRFFRDGVLTVTLNSSVVRNEMNLRKNQLVKAINDSLLSDPMFIQDDPSSRLVTEIRFK